MTELQDVAEDLAATGAAIGLAERARPEAVEEAIRIRAAYLRPGEDVVTGAAVAGGGPVRWTVGATDASVNLRRGLPVHAVSVAAHVDGAVLAGAVAEPATGRLWSASRGDGARLHDPRWSDGWIDLRAAPTGDLAHALVALGLGRTRRERVAQAPLVAELVAVIGDVRITGAAAVSLCWVAAGFVDAFYQRRVPSRQVTAAALIAAEAGATVHWPTGDGPVLAAVPRIATALTTALTGLGALR